MFCLKGFWPRASHIVSKLNEVIRLSNRILAVFYTVKTPKSASPLAPQSVAGKEVEMLVLLV
jgi:hypothetical protein